MCGVEGVHAPVIDDEQPGVSELVEEFVVAAVGLGLGECEEQARQAVVAGGDTLQAGLVSECLLSVEKRTQDTVGYPRQTRRLSTSSKVAALLRNTQE